jgi:hypothetical protein
MSRVLLSGRSEFPTYHEQQELYPGRATSALCFGLVGCTLTFTSQRSCHGTYQQQKLPFTLTSFVGVRCRCRFIWSIARSLRFKSGRWLYNLAGEHVISFANGWTRGPAAIKSAFVKKIWGNVSVVGLQVGKPLGFSGTAVWLFPAEAAMKLDVATLLGLGR